MHQIQHAGTPQRLTDGHVFIDEKVGREEVVQEAWWLVGACDKERRKNGNSNYVQMSFRRFFMSFMPFYVTDLKHSLIVYLLQA